MANIVVDGTIGANRLLILDSTGKIPAVDGSQITAITAGNIATGTIPIARIDTGTTANKIVVLDGSGRLPAVSAALITNIPGATKSASDPTVSTNPSGGVGTEWHNTTSGEVYICTDATTGANIWTNVGAGTGDVAPFHPHQGANYAYAIGGKTSSPVDIIDRFAFASDGDATDVGNLTESSYAAAGAFSITYGYAVGGTGTVPDNNSTSEIQKFQLVASANSADVGDISQPGFYKAGCSSSTHGYAHGGQDYKNNTPANWNTIDKFLFSNESTTADVGNLTTIVHQHSTAASSTYGYYAGGYDYYGNSPNAD